MNKNLVIAERLKNGEIVSYRPHGNSMAPKIKSGQLVTLQPCTIDDLNINDIVFCKIKGRYLLHLVAARAKDGFVLITNNAGHTNGWTRTVFGKAIKVEN